MYGPVRTVVWQGSAGDRRPYADRQHVAVQRIESGIVDIGSQHALTEIVEDDDACGPAESAKGLFMEFGPDL